MASQIAPPPFDLARLEAGLADQVQAVAGAASRDIKAIVALIDALRERLAAAPDDMEATLALAWALREQVETGVFIDDVGVDADEARALFDKALASGAIDLKRQGVADFDPHLSSTHKRAQDFVERQRAKR